MPQNKVRTSTKMETANEVKKEKEHSPKTVVKSLGQCSFSSNNGDMSAIDVKDGKIIRIRPEHYDAKYTRDELNAWEIEINGEILRQPSKG